VAVMATAKPERNEPAPRWLRVWALFTVVSTLVLLLLGGVVTTFRVGMADPVWPTSPLYLPKVLVFGSSEPLSVGFLIEHSHRFAGYFVGVCVIVLAVGLWFQGRCRSLRWLGIAGFLAVSVQGLLGGFRVVLDSLLGTELAAFHGCLAQAVLAVLVAVAVFAGPAPRALEVAAARARGLRRLMLAVLALTYVQIVWGALVRHHLDPLAQRAHLLTAFALVALTGWLARVAWEDRQVRTLLRAPLLVLGGLLLVQVGLGVEAWLGRFAGVLLPEAAPVTIGQAIVRTAHLFLGSLILVTVLVVTFRVYRATAHVLGPQGEGARTEVSQHAPEESKVLQGSLSL
jgi:cytochrome c oxidase assembly protein subunit 15